MKSGTDIGRHIDKHGDGVKVVSLWVYDAKKRYEEVMKSRAKPFIEPGAEEEEY
jgi:4-hydroxyphenylpyruvate dioxygenase